MIISCIYRERTKWPPHCFCFRPYWLPCKRSSLCLPLWRASKLGCPIRIYVNDAGCPGYEISLGNWISLLPHGFGALQTLLVLNRNLHIFHHLSPLNIDPHHSNTRRSYNITIIKSWNDDNRLMRIKYQVITLKVPIRTTTLYPVKYLHNLCWPQNETSSP